MAIPSICILAGGRGTRLGELTAAKPKPLLTVAGRPFLEHILVSLSQHGAHRIILSIGYLASQFSEVLGDGSQFGLQLTYVEDGDTPAGTAGGIRNCLPLLDDPFIVMYGDSLLRANPAELLALHIQTKRAATMAVMRSSLGSESPNCIVQGDRVVAYSKDPRPLNAAFVDYGMLVLSKHVFDSFTGSDLSDLQSQLALSENLTAFEVDDPYLEIGTPDALDRVERSLSVRTDESD